MDITEKEMETETGGRRSFKQEIPRNITPTTENTVIRYHKLWYHDRSLWEKSSDTELDMVGASGTIRWLISAELKIITKDKKIIPMTLYFNYKRNKDGSIEERELSAT